MSPIPECRGKGEREGEEGRGKVSVLQYGVLLGCSWLGSLGKHANKLYTEAHTKKPTAAIDTCLKGKCMLTFS